MKVACCFVLLLLGGACVLRPEPTASSAASAVNEPPRPGALPQDLPGNPAPAAPGTNVPAIKVDTVGYPTKWSKFAIFNVDPKGAVIRDDAGNVVARIDDAKVGKFGADRASRDPVWQVEFTELDRPGRYTLAVGSTASAPFEIGDDVYRKVLTAAQKMFYFQRTRCKLEAPYAVWEGDEFLRDGVSHVHEDVGWDIEHHPERKHKWKLEGGWHDAGNFDMYVPSTAPTAQGLLMAYERHPKLFQDRDLNIPESGNGIPDLLDEARWGIVWVLSMQQPDGGFRLRETTLTQEEAPQGPAHQDRSVRWIDRVGSASTGKGTALAALGARVYRPHDAAFAARCEEAAQRGWAWLERHPDRVTVPAMGAAQQNGYLLWDDCGDPKLKLSDFGARFMAAAEMFRTFRLPAARAKLEQMMGEHGASAYDFPYGGWTNLSRWVMMELVDDERAPSGLRGEARRRLVQAAGMHRQSVEARDGYFCATQPQDYYWGSNSNLLEKSLLMVYAQRLDPRGSAWARQGARHQWHWILGRNPNGFSMITRVGHAPRALYHLEWGPHYPKVVPGYLVGGPNYDNMKFLAPGAPAKALLWEAPHDLRSGVPKGELWHWVQSDLWEGGFLPEGDWSEGWWAVTEPDIYYNMNLVWFAAEMVAQQSAVAQVEAPPRR